MKNTVKKKFGTDLIYCVLMYGSTISLVFLSSLYFTCTKEELLTRVLVSLVMISVILFYIRCIPEEEYLHKKRNRSYQRLFIFYLLFYVVTFCMTPMPSLIRPMFVIGICFTLLFDVQAGILFQIYFSFLLILLEKDDMQVVLLYFLSAVISCSIARFLLKKEFIPYVLLMLFAVNSALSGIFNYLLKESYTTMDLVLSLIANLLGVIAVLLTLLYINYRIVNRLRSRLLPFSQKNNELLHELKNQSYFVYKHCVKVGDLAEKIAEHVGANALLAKTASYYIKIGKIEKPKDYAVESLVIANVHHFPYEMIQIMKQYNGKIEKPSTIEAGIVMIADTLISSFEYLEIKRSDLPIDKNTVIDQALKNRFDKQDLNDCQITIGMYQEIRRFLLEEVTNYDFTNRMGNGQNPADSL